MHDDMPKCPRCGSTAFYRYGRTKNGKQRYLCLICNRQYVVNRRLHQGLTRPICPACHDPMHVYRRENGAIRYRCSNYPDCKTFVKVTPPESPHASRASDHA